MWKTQPVGLLKLAYKVRIAQGSHQRIDDSLQGVLFDPSSRTSHYVVQGARQLLTSIFFIFCNGT